MSTLNPTPEKQVAISVIVPIYNLAPYITDCLNSLMSQKGAPHYEIILIDDCSCDDSYSICEKFQHAYPEKIYLFKTHQNQGSSTTRNLGLTKVRGDYFAFVDGDDLLPPNALRDLYEAAVSYNVDIVKGNNRIIDTNKSLQATYNSQYKRILHGENILSTFFEHRLFRGHPWGKLMRTQTFIDIQYQPGVTMAQDTLYCAELFANAKTMVLITNTVYEYHRRTGSTTNRKYDTKAYLWWLYSIEQSGRFAQTAKQKRRHKQLQMRTLMQISKEARRLNNLALGPVVHEIHQHQARWNLLNLWQVARQGLGVRWMLHFIQFAVILAQLERRIEKPMRFSNAS